MANASTPCPPSRHRPFLLASPSRRPCRRRRHPALRPHSPLLPHPCRPRPSPPPPPRRLHRPASLPQLTQALSRMKPLSLRPRPPCTRRPLRHHPHRPRPFRPASPTHLQGTGWAPLLHPAQVVVRPPAPFPSLLGLHLLTQGRPSPAQPPDAGRCKPGPRSVRVWSRAAALAHRPRSPTCMHGARPPCQASEACGQSLGKTSGRLSRGVERFLQADLEIGVAALGQEGT